MLRRLLQLPLSNLPFKFIERNISSTSCKLKSVKKKYLDFSKVPKVKEEDLEIQYVRGSGPGGQSTNKTSNCVVMKHIPTGIVVKCHETRSQFQNKELAVERLINMLDKHFNGEDAIENQEKRILKKKSLEKVRRQKKRAAMKEAMKDREELERKELEELEEQSTEQLEKKDQEKN